MIKKIIETVKDYLSVIAIVPLTLGGIWQILSLSSISTAYLRFFSVTQQIADGILILFILVIFYTIYYFFKDLVSLKVRSRIHLSKYKTINLIGLILASISLAVFIIFISSSLVINILSGEITLPILAFSAIMIFFFLSMIILTYTFSVALLEKKNMLLKISTESEIYLFIRATILTFLTLGGIAALLSILPEFHKAYYIPSNLKNIKYTLDKYASEAKSNRDSVRIIYMNDKYIFIKDSSKVEVVELNYMFRGKAN